MLLKNCGFTLHIMIELLASDCFYYSTMRDVRQIGSGDMRHGRPA